jgi:hypothetical protein
LTAKDYEGRDPLFRKTTKRVKWQFMNTFCKWSCVLGYIRHSSNLHNKQELYSYTKCAAKEIDQIPIIHEIPTAPPREALEFFGGDMTYETFDELCKILPYATGKREEFILSTTIKINVIKNNTHVTKDSLLDTFVRRPKAPNRNTQKIPVPIKGALDIKLSEIEKKKEKEKDKVVVANNNNKETTLGMTKYDYQYNIKSNIVKDPPKNPMQKRLEERQKKQQQQQQQQKK